MNYQKSYDYGNGEACFPGETIGARFDRIVATYPEEPALIAIPQGRRFTWGALREEVDAMAHALILHGVGRGDRVAIWSVNNYEWVVTQFAASKVGAILVNVNPAYRTVELSFALQKSRSKILFLVDSFRTSNYVETFLEACPEAAARKSSQNGVIRSRSFPDLKRAVVIGDVQRAGGLMNFDEFIGFGRQDHGTLLADRAAELDIDDIVNIQYTSGTTGTPKGVMLTHQNILTNAIAVGRALRLKREDRVCVPVPFYHCFGMVVSNLTCVAQGASIVIPAPVFNAEATLRAVSNERCTVLHGVPTIFIQTLEHPDFAKFDLSSLRTGIMAGAPCPADLARRVVDKMHMPQFLIAYGMTESSPVCTITGIDDPLDRRVGTVGVVMPGQELKIIDPATRKTVPRGEPGEICFRGYHVMAGYDQDPRGTAESIDERHWLHSGDIGSMDAEGYVTISGRIKEMVIRGGENVYPREIEDFLHTLDGIADAYVVGVPDEKYGEELCACVRLTPGSERNHNDESFRAACKGKIAHFKIPRYWLVVDDYPQTVTGKIQKFKLRELAVEQLGLGMSMV